MSKGHQETFSVTFLQSSELCDGSDFFKNDYRTARHGPHELRSFGRGCRLIGPKPEMPLCEQALKRHPDFVPAWLVVFA